MKIIATLTLLTTTLLFQGCTNNNSPSSTKILRIASTDDPTNLDPRLARDLASTTTIRLLYEGLTRANTQGEQTPAVAETIEISPDMTQYTFYLRETYWSNGDKVTAHDFERSWKALLDPKFLAPNSYQFYAIKGAKEAKEGKGSLNDVGIKAIDDRTLVVTLNSPVPYFLELTSFHSFFPVHAQWDQLSLQEKAIPEKFVGNGPFILKSWAHQNQVDYEKNPRYRAADNVKLEGIQIIISNENTALQMFEKGDLDWTGSPLSIVPPDAVQGLKNSNNLQVAAAAGTSWFRFNTDKVPFNNAKIRKALSYAIDRQAIAEHILQGGQTPATGVIPHTMRLQDTPYFTDNNITQARQLFDEGLQELGINREELPKIALSYTQSDRNSKIAQAVQQQWKNALGIELNLESYEPKVYYNKLIQHDFQINIGSWFADIRDPINFLEVFKSKDNATNNTQWEHPEYIQLLDASALESDKEKRDEILRKAEALLMDQMPIAPIYFTAFNYLKKPEIHDVTFSELGFLDLIDAHIERE